MHITKQLMDFRNFGVKINIVLIYLRGEREREREHAHTHWFTPYIPSLVGGGRGQSPEPEI